ncbi:MAG: DUF4416 family protein [Nitrospirota bacterium]
MGKVRKTESAFLFVGTLFSETDAFVRARERLEICFGAILAESSQLQWDYSSYYTKEIGSPIYRRFVFFEKLIDPGMLSRIKLTTNEIEESFSEGGKRRINLDPGYLTLSKVVLASTKNYAHRIYLSDGIYGEVTLIYRNGSYEPHIFTYKDYKDKAYIDIFLDMREKLKTISGM